MPNKLIRSLFRKLLKPISCIHRPVTVCNQSIPPDNTTNGPPSCKEPEPQQLEHEQTRSERARSTPAALERSGSPGPSPIQAIPNEIIIMIFIRCLPTSTSIYRRTTTHDAKITDPHFIPLLLSSVCGTWRQIACSTPELWENCWLSFYHTELNEIWMNRAGTRMLSLYGNTWGHNPNRQPNHKPLWDQFLLSILPFQHRWKTFELDAGLKANATTLTPQFDTPTLEALRLAYKCLSGPSWMNGLLSGAPQLRVLEIEAVWAGSEAENILNHQRFPQLSTLKVCAIHELSAMQALVNLPQLIEAAFTIQCHETDFEIKPIVHDRLGKLHLAGASGARNWSSYSGMLKNLILPALHTFHCEGRLVPHSFLAFLNQSQCRITEFKLTHPYLDNDNLLGILKHDSINCSLERFKLFEGCSFMQPDLFRFMLYSSSNNYFPHLIQLDLEHQTSTDLERLLAGVIISRCSSYTCTCVDCKLLPQGREIRLQEVHVRWINWPGRSPELARMLLVDGSVDPKDAVSVIIIDMFKTIYIPCEEKQVVVYLG